MTRQEALLRKACTERGIADPEIRLDHENGRATVDGRTVGIIHPDSFFEASEPLMDAPKTVRFYFAGYCSNGGGRLDLMERFKDEPDSVVAHSRRGRGGRFKGTWDPSYYEPLASSEFGLCPHHLDWSGDWSTLWTYRFIDCCMVGTIPVLFRETPLAAAFVDGFRYSWDDDPVFVFAPEDAEHNRALAEDRWRL